MDLLKGLPPEVAKRLVERSKGVIESDEKCEIHPRYNKLLMPDGSLVCPVCYRESRDGDVTKEASRRYHEETTAGKRLYLQSDSIVSNKNILSKGFKDFKEISDQEKWIKSKAQSYVHDVAAGEALTIFLEGAPGRGKSHLAMAILKNANAISNGKRCLFVNFPTLRQKIRAGYVSRYPEESEAAYIQKMISADILAIDDIADEVNPNDLKRDVSDFSTRILYPVLEARAETKPTIITSNISWKNLESVIDPRLYSRMAFRLKVLSFLGIDDKRKMI